MGSLSIKLWTLPKNSKPSVTAGRKWANSSPTLPWPYRDLDKLLKSNNMRLSVDAVLSIANTIPIISVKMAEGTLTKTLFLTKRQEQIKPFLKMISGGRKLKLKISELEKKYSKSVKVRKIICIFAFERNNPKIQNRVGTNSNSSNHDTV